MRKRWILACLLLVLGLACGITAFRLGAANPTAGSISPTSEPLSWQGSAVGGVATDEPTCQEGVNCDTFTLTVLGDPADWAGKEIEVRLSWTALASDYDMYIHKDSNTGVIVADSATPPPGTSEVASIVPSEDGTGVFTVHVVYFTAAAADQYHAVARVLGADAPPPPTPPKSDDWAIRYHGTCCEGNLAAAGDNFYMLLPVLVNGNIIMKSSDGGKTWVQKYPPVPASVPYGIEGDMQAFGNDVIFFGTELAAAVVAHSDDAGETFLPPVQNPLVSAGNDQAWSYLGPFGDMRPGGPLGTDEPYVLAGWMRIGTGVFFSFDGGLTFPVQTPLAGVNGSGPEHAVCHQVATDPPVNPPADSRVAHASFAHQKAGRHGAWGTDRKFYWTETVEGQDLYVCSTNDFGVNWTGIRHPVSPGPGAEFVVTHTAFDSKGTLYVLHGNKLYVSLNQGQSFAHTHTLPRFGNAGRADSGADQFFVADCGTIHIALLADAPGGAGHVYYLRGANVDTATPTWEEELVDVVGNVRLDFMQIVMNANGVPAISYTTPDEEVTTASREVGVAACLIPVSAVSHKLHDGVPFDVNLPLIGTPGIEPRTGGESGNHQVVVTFPDPVNIPGGGVTVEAPAGGMVSGVNTVANVVTIDLTGIQNAQTITIHLTGVSDGTVTENIAIPMGILLGDVNASRRVDSGDVTRVRKENLQPLAPANFRADVDASGRIDSGDLTIIRRQNLTGLP